MYIYATAAFPPVQKIDSFSLNIIHDKGAYLHCFFLTMPAPIPHTAATAKMLKTALPTIVPIPMSPFVINVPIMFVNSSGAEVAIAIKVAPATSLGRLSSKKEMKDKTGF
jgi:hypothetical protein